MDWGAWRWGCRRTSVTARSDVGSPHQKGPTNTGISTGTPKRVIARSGCGNLYTRPPSGDKWWTSRRTGGADAYGIKVWLPAPKQMLPSSTGHTKRRKMRRSTDGLMSSRLRAQAPPVLLDVGHALEGQVHQLQLIIAPLPRGNPPSPICPGHTTSLWAPCRILVRLSGRRQAHMQHHVSQQMPSVGVHSAVGTPGVDYYYNILVNDLLEFSLHIDNAFSKVSARAGRRQVGAQGAVARPQRRSSHLAHLAQLLEAGSDAAQVAHPILSHVHLSHVHPILSHVYLPSPT